MEIWQWLGFTSFILLMLGLIPFRRLLLIENILDLGDQKVRDVMCGRSDVRALVADAPWEENLAIIGETRFSRYPLVERQCGQANRNDLRQGRAPA